LDRDDTLIEDPGYINHPGQVKLLDGAAEALIELKAMGYMLVVVSNQSAVARGIVTEKVLAEIHDRLKELLAEKGAYLDQIYYCPYHPEAVIPKYRRESDWRKPNPGMMLTAADQMDIDLSQSWMIGNSNCDIEAGLRASCKTILINRSWDYKQAQPGDPKPHYNAVNIKEATNIVKKYHRSPGDVETQILSPPAGQIEASGAEHTEERLELICQTYGGLTSAVSANSAAEKESQPAEPQTDFPPQQTDLSVQELGGDRTEQLLNRILQQLKTMQRTDIFGEFSIMRMMAGIVQIVVLFCLLMTIWFLMSPDRQDSAVFISLGFAGVLQLMSLTFYIMQGRK